MKLLSLLLLSISAVFVSAQGIQETLNDFPKTPQAHYPTDFTRGILPIPCHSHNDYWRAAPLYTAIAGGCVSVEADVWLFPSSSTPATIYVGHDTASLTKKRTFASLYIDPLVEILKKQNPRSEFVTEDSSRNGVFDTAVGQTLYLWVDLKTSGPGTWPAVVKALEPLREKGWLTTYNGTAIVSGPITVIGTGNTPRDLVEDQKTRDYFWDGPLLSLESTGVTKELSPIASVDLKRAVGEVKSMEGLNATQIEAVKGNVKTAADRGIGVRYWELPGWPISKRGKIWRQLVDAGVTLLNVDDIEAVSEGEW